MFTETFTPQVNGVVTSIQLFTEELVKQGHEVEIFAPTPGKELFQNAPVHRFRSVTFLPYPEFKATLPPIGINRLIKDQNFDIIHTHGPFAMGWAGVRTAKKNNIPSISTFHTPIADYVNYLIKGPFINTGKNIAWTYSKKHYNKYNHVITPSQIIKKLLEEKGIKTPISVIPTGIKLEKFQLENTAYIHEKYSVRRFILHAGRLSSEKNVDVVIKALPLIKDFPQLRLVITSKGPSLKKLMKLRDQMDLKQRVIFTGFVKDQDLIALYKEADLSIIASGADTQGLVVTESMATGTPVIGANALALPEVINGKNGELFKLNDEHNLAEKINNLLLNQNKREKMGKEAIKTAEQNTIQKRTKELVTLYEKLGKE